MKNMVKTIAAVTLLPLALFSCEEDSPKKKACLEMLGKSQLQKGAHAPELGQLIGKKGADIANVPGFETVRILAPNSAATMDYREDRINLHMDCDGNIIATTSG